MLFGAHESISGGVFNAIIHGQTATCDTVQIFNKSNAQWRAAALKDAELKKYFDLQKETGITVSTSHASYLINLASPNKELEDKSIAGIKLEMERCEILKIPSLVFHPGSHVGEGEEKGMNQISKNINKLFGMLKDNNVMLLLEVTAGQGSNLGYKFEQIAYMISKVENKKKVGVCFDTCHVFASGYPLSDPADYKKTMKAFDDIIGIDRIQIIHMNDSKGDLGSKKDRHEHIGKGKIGLEGFRNIINDSRLAKIPKILETPKEEDLKEDIQNLKVLRSLVKK